MKIKCKDCVCGILQEPVDSEQSTEVLFCGFYRQFRVADFQRECFEFAMPESVIQVNESGCQVLPEEVGEREL